MVIATLVVIIITLFVTNASVLYIIMRVANLELEVYKHSKEKHNFYVLPDEIQKIFIQNEKKRQDIIDSMERYDG